MSRGMGWLSWRGGGKPQVFACCAFSQHHVLLHVAIQPHLTAQTKR